jgi:hypothetical protein
MLRTILRALGALLLAATMANPALAGKDETKLHGYGHAAWKITTPSGRRDHDRPLAHGAN